MRRHLRILAIHYRAAFLAQLEYRANFVASFALSGCWPLWVLSLLSVLFYHSSNLGGWTFNEAILVIGLYDVFIGLQETILAPNISQLTEHIQKGTLDFVLLKPANGQVLSTVTACNLLRLSDVLIGFGLIGAGLYRLGHIPTTVQILTFGLMIPAGMVILYSIWLLLATLAFWFVRVENFGELFYAFYETGRFPVSIYSRWLRFALTYIVPVAFLTTFPAATLLGKLSIGFVLASVGIAVALFYLSSRFWNYAIRFYSSASS